MRNDGSDRGLRTGFTLVELAVVIVVIGVLAAFGVPRFIKSVERAKAGEAFTYLTAVRSAQSRYAAKSGSYAEHFKYIDVEAPSPRYFSVPTSFTCGRRSWSLTLARAGASPRYGAYTVTFTQDGYDPTRSTIDGLAEINPVAGSREAAR